MVCPLISSFSFLLFVVSDALMRTFVLILFVVAAGTMIGGIARSVAAAPKVASVEDAGALANQVYNRLEAPVLEARTQGVQNARRAARTPVQRLSIEAAPGFKLTEGAELEHEFESTLWFEIGARAKRAQRAWTQTGDALIQQSHAERWLFVTEAERKFAQWWAKQAIADHLEEDLDEVQKHVENWRNKLAPWLTELDILDLDAETARLSAETAEALLEAQHAESEFRAHITIDVHMVLQDEPHDILEQAGAQNPWIHLLQYVEDFPEIRALYAQAEAHQMRAKANRSRTLELGVGARARLTPQRNVLLNPMLSLDIPIARNNAQEAAIESAEAVALQAQARWKADMLRAWLQGEADRHNTIVRALELLTDGAIEQLKTRVDRLTQAFEAGHVDVRRVFWAMRDLHEAKHKALLLRADLAASKTAAAGVQMLLEETKP